MRNLIDTRPLPCALLVASLLGFPVPSLAQDQAAAGENLRIVGGSPAAPGRWPSLVLVQVALGNGFTGNCGGTVVDRQWVLTAAHCIVGDRTGVVASPQSVSIVAGTVDLAAGGRRIAVTQVLPHPTYRHNSRAKEGDVALLRLAEPAQVEPQALLAAAAAPRILLPRETATVAGFGRVQPVTIPGSAQQVRPTGPQGSSQRLLQVNVPIVSTERCRQSYDAGITAAHICAGFEEGGRDSCQGDSGGPLFMLGPVGRPVQVGVVSWGEGCAQPGKFGIYASVPAFESFIRQHVPAARFVGEAQRPTPTATPTPSPPARPPATAQGQTQGQTPAPRPPTPRPPTADPVRPVLAAGQPAPATPPGLVGQVSLDILPGERVTVGEAITLRIQSGATGTLMVFNIDATGRTTQLFPNRRSAPNPSAFQAATQLRPGSLVVLPGPADGFVLRARLPAGENSIIAVIAPPGARVEDLLMRNMDLGTIPEPDAFFEDLAALLEQARARLPLIDTAPEAEIARELAIRPVRPPIPMAERRFTIVERTP